MSRRAAELRQSQRTTTAVTHWPVRLDDSRTQMKTHLLFTLRIALGASSALRLSQCRSWSSYGTEQECGTGIL